MAALEQLAQALAEVRQQLEQERSHRLAAEQQGGQIRPAADGGQEQQVDSRVLNTCPVYS